MIDPEDKTARKMMESMGAEDLIVPRRGEGAARRQLPLQKVVALEVAKNTPPIPQGKGEGPKVGGAEVVKKEAATTQNEEEGGGEEEILEPMDEGGKGRAKETDAPPDQDRSGQKKRQRTEGPASKKKLELECPRCGTIFFIKPWKISCIPA